MGKQKDAEYKLKPFPELRKLVIDLMYQGKKKNIVHGIWDADITRAREILQHWKDTKGESLSFTSFVLYCIARAVDAHKYMHAYRKGRKGKNLVIFDEVDIATIVERDMPDGRKMPVSYTLRAANKKSFREISDEIQHAKVAQLGGDVILKKQTLRFAKLPWFLRRLVYKKMMRDPWWRKEYGATVGVTAVGMFGTGRGWAIPITPMTLTITVGSIETRLVKVDGQIMEREFLCLTTSIDHDLIDGAPAARFLADLKGTLEAAAGLDDLIV